MTFEEATLIAMRTGGEVHRRQLRKRAARWLEHCRAHGVDPLHPTWEDWAAYEAAHDWDANRANKERSAVRRVLLAAGVLDHEHGLGSGNQRWRLDGLLGTPTGDLLAGFVDARYAHRPAVARSALAKLLTWADLMAIPMEAVTMPDLDDFDYWLRSVGGQREIMVIARDWVEYLAGV